MDPFTQRILEKAEQRSRVLGISKTTKFPLTENETKTEGHQRKLHVIEKKDAAKSVGSPTKVTRQFAVDKENMDVGIEINITTGPDVQVQVEVEEQDAHQQGSSSASNESGGSAVKIRDSSRNRLQRLGKLYSNSDLSSPIQRTEGRFHEEASGDSENLRRPKQKFGKLAALADSIKSWEDDTSHPDYKHTNFNEKQVLVDVHKSLEEDSKRTKSESTETTSENNAKCDRAAGAKLKWDKNVLDSLEAQGFQRRESSNTKLSYEYKSPKKTEEKPRVVVVEEKKTPINDNKQVREERKFGAIKSGLVSDRAAAFESKASPSKPEKDPAEMSLKERMMLFEKNKGEALIPKAAFAMSAPVEKKREQNFINKNAPKNPSEAIKDFPISEVNIRDKVAALTGASATISEQKIRADIIKKKQEDMKVLANRFNKQKEFEKSPEKAAKTNIASVPPPPPPMPPKNIENKKHSDLISSTNNKRRSPGVGFIGEESQAAQTEDSKRLKTSGSNAGRLYPNLSDLETEIEEDYTTATISAPSEEKYDSQDNNDSYMESEDSDSTAFGDVSLGREIMKVVKSNESRNGGRAKTMRYSDTNGDGYCGDSSVNSGSFGSVGVDDYLDEALAEEEESESEEFSTSTRRNSHGTTSSNSFSYQKKPRKYSGCEAISEENDDYECNPSTFKSPVKSALTINPPNEDNVVTLVHTVSFYRRQQASNSNNSTPVRVAQRDERHVHMERIAKKNDSEDNSSDEPDDEEKHLVQEKIKKLLDEVCKQQQVIAQTSQALNLCASTIEFSGSTESVEGERHLLVATHRRQAALDEVQRLRVEGRLLPNNGAEEKGRLVIKDITVPLKQDYIRKLSTDAISGHHLVCLLKCNETVLATKTVPTLPGLMAVKFPDVLQMDVHADFKAVIEIYGMTAQREVLPHEVKYHINLNKKSGVKTPKKKNTDSRLIMPMVQSPAGPHVVRTPALVQYGFAIFSLREVQRTTWTLAKSSGVSPLEGTVHMKMNCELTVVLEYRGFLTMFEEISGFGAWHRRWCCLNGNIINYWKYPDDEKKKSPMGSIDLGSCVTQKVTTAPRDLCARLNTLLLECQRPAQNSDVESFLIVPKGNVTIVKYLLSADTKEERNEWAAIINKTISLLRAWKCPNHSRN